MLIRLNAGNDGIQEYLESGHKDGRQFTRDELDERIVLAGDLEATNAVIQSIDSDRDRYLHITLAFKEDHVPSEVLREVAVEFEAFAFSAYRPDEYCFYAEAHVPRIKSYTNRRTGEFVERKPHIHVVIPHRNLLIGRALNLFGKATQQERFIDAFQEHINHKFGFASPKANRRIEFANTSEMISRYKGDVFIKSNTDLRGSLLAALIVRDARTVGDFKKVVAEHGEVRVRNEGKPTQYLNVRRIGEGKGTNLKDYVFSREFIELSQSEKRAVLTREIQRKYEVAGVTKRSPATIVDALREWHAVRAKEIKYLNSGNRKLYADYRAAVRKTQLAMLAERENRHYKKYDRENVDGRQQYSDIERIGDHFRTADRHLESARRSIGQLDRGAGNIADRSARRAVAAAIRRYEPPQGRIAQDCLSERRRPADNMIGQLQYQAHEYEQQRNFDTRPEVAEIKRTLDARRLLSRLAATHGVIGEKYAITKGEGGDDRVICGTRHLNVSDFLTQEMKLPWAKAEPILREVYAAQLDQAPVRNVPREPRHSPLWSSFQGWKKDLADHNAKAWDAQRASEKERRLAKTTKFQTTKARLYAHGGVTPAERRAGLSIARMEKVQADKALAIQIKAERDTLKSTHSIKSSELFRVYLQERAQAGDVQALAELRRQRTEPDHRDTKTACLATGVSASTEPDRQGKDVLAQTSVTIYSVARNGNVTYRIAGRDVLRDEARVVKFLDSKDRAVLEIGLRLALQKFGPILKVNGDDDFKRRFVQTSVDTGLQVEFSDPALNAYRQQLVAARKPALASDTSARAPVAAAASSHAPHRAATFSGGADQSLVEASRLQATEVDEPASPAP